MAAASILVAPSSAFHFHNANLGDLVIRGINGGPSQKILLGTSSNAAATLTITEAKVTNTAPVFALSNAYGEAALYSSNDAVGIGIPAPKYTLDVAGTIAISNVPVMDSNRNLANIESLSTNGPLSVGSSAVVNGSIALSNPTGVATLYSSNSFLGVNNSNPTASLDVNGDAVVNGLLTVTSDASFASNLTVLGSLNATTVNYAYSNVTVYTSQEVRSNLHVEGLLSASNVTTLASNLTVLGETTLSNALVVYGPTSLSNTLAVTSNLDVGGAATLQDTLTVASNVALNDALTVQGAATFSNDATFSGSNLTVHAAATFSNVVAMASNVSVLGDATLSNALVVYGPTSLSNTLAVTSNLDVGGAVTLRDTLTVASNVALNDALTVQGAATFSNDATFSGSNLTVYGVATFSNTVTFSSNLILQQPIDASGTSLTTSNLTVLGTTTLCNAASMMSDVAVQGFFSASNAAYFASNLTVLGSLNATTVNYAYSNVTVYTSQEVRSNLHVEGSLSASNVTALASNLTVLGETTLSNTLVVASNALLYSNVTLLGGSNTRLAFDSGDAGSVALRGMSNFLGINTHADSNPMFTLDVEGDINFTGQIYRNGAIFSGWSSNAHGNYINSNAAFRGEPTAEDIMLLHTFGSGLSTSNLAFTLSNATGRTSLWSESNNLGVGGSNPAYTVDVAGTVRATSNVLATAVGVGTLLPAYPVDVQINTGGVSMNCASKVVASEFTVFSDKRIKTSVQTLDPQAYLDLVDALTVREFAYIDEEEKGAGLRTGFIAQEVEAVAPAVVKTVSGFLPNVFREFRVERTPGSGDAVLVAESAGAVAPLLRAGDLIKCRHGGSVVLLQVRDVLLDEQRALRVRVDAGALPDGAASVFVVGTHVDDFKTLSHDQLNSLAIGAIKAQQAQIRELREAVHAMGLIR
jgi:predicted acyltransferase (DUF342 family)